jgi:S-DNA-T family DNA segregation ATPase FtsK/SpoIIIE
VRLKLTYERGGGRPDADLLVSTETTTTVGALADYLAAADPGSGDSGRGGSTGGDDSKGRAAGGHTLVLVGARRHNLAPGARLGDSGILSGATVALAGTGDISGAEGPPRQVAAVVHVVSGPDEGREFPLPAGSVVVGRDRSCEVRLSDPLVSRRHARMTIGETVELVDMGSSNGLVIGDERAERVALHPGSTVTLGDTMLSVRLLAPPGHRATASAVSFNRPPRVDARYAGRVLVAPEPPDAPRMQRFPLLQLLAPLLLGVVLYVSTRSVFSLVFVAMSPVLIVASATEGRLSGRKSYRSALAQFRDDVADLVADATEGRDEERRRRVEELPSASEAAAAATALAPLLWSRWPDLAGFAELRLGLGTQPARNRVEIPSGKRNNRPLWKELLDAVEPFATVDGVPVPVDLRQAGALGIGGPRPIALGVARALVVQAACLHSPAELVLAGLASTETGPSWEWVKWFPHCLSAQSPLSSGPLVSTDAACAALLAELAQLVNERESRHGDHGGPRPLPVVLVVVEDDAPVVRSEVVDLARRGAPVGVHLLWVAADVNRLPAACQVFVEAAEAGDSAAGFVHAADLVAPLSLEPIDETAAVVVARRLASVVDSSAHEDTQGDLPRAVSLLTLVGHELAASAEAVVDRWNESRSIVTGPKALPSSAGRLHRDATLRAIVGESAAGPHVLDLRTHGPHALVGGTTGSGKSELLQSWILAMAASNSPQRVTFLLVDYKGGAAFSECLHLPHTVGLVTDLSPHLVRRALMSLSAELKHREDLLHRRRAKDLLELERAGDPQAPPSLVIVVDEFAALVKEVPDFVDGVVDVAQRGRSLGLHLILATQRPAGVIKDNLRANTNLRLALRVADDADSVDVLGTAEAASFDPAIPGRAVSRTGPAQLVPFQAAYAGGWTSDLPEGPTIEVVTFGFGPRCTWEPPPPEEPLDPGAPDIQRLVTTIRSAHQLAEIPDPRLPWLPELAAVYDLARLPTRRRDDELVFAVADDPARQAQPTVSFNPDADGNLAVYGTGNAGKSTLLRTIAVAAGFTVRGGPCHVYGLDFGSRGLAILEPLPHVGGIIPGVDDERVGRLLTMLRATVDERAARYSAVGAGTLTAYRQLADRPDEPRILLLVDGMGAFRSGYDGTEHAKIFETFLGIAADGRPVGVHVVIAADRPGAVPVALAASVQRRIALRLADPNDYAAIGLPMDVVDESSPPGRGLFGETEIQVAVLGTSADTAVQAGEIVKFAASMRVAGFDPAPPVERLPELVPLADLPKEIGGRPVIGVSGATLAPVSFEPRGTFTVAGPPASGRTTALTAVVAALRRWRADATLVYVGNRRSGLADAFDWRLRAVDADEAVAVAGEVPGLAGEAEEDMAPWVVVVEGLPDFLNGPADPALCDMAKTLVANGHLLVTEGEPAALSGSYPLLTVARTSRSGIVLQPEQSDGVLFRSQFPRLRRAAFPVGRGLFVPRGGQPEVVQVAVA